MYLAKNAIINHALRSLKDTSDRDANTGCIGKKMVSSSCAHTKSVCTQHGQQQHPSLTGGEKHRSPWPGCSHAQIVLIYLFIYFICHRSELSDLCYAEKQ